MAQSARAASAVAFDFDFFRFNGKGATPSVVPNVDQADFIRSRYSVPEQLVQLAQERVRDWGRQQGVNINPKSPFPSSQTGKYWLEFRVGGLTL